MRITATAFSLPSSVRGYPQRCGSCQRIRWDRREVAGRAPERASEVPNRLWISGDRVEVGHCRRLRRPAQFVDQGKGAMRRIGSHSLGEYRREVAGIDCGATPTFTCHAIPRCWSAPSPTANRSTLWRRSRSTTRSTPRGTSGCGMIPGSSRRRSLAPGSSCPALGRQHRRHRKVLIHRARRSRLQASSGARWLSRRAGGLRAHASAGEASTLDRPGAATAGKRHVNQTNDTIAERSRHAVIHIA